MRWTTRMAIPGVFLGAAFGFVVFVAKGNHRGSTFAAELWTTLSAGIFMALTVCLLGGLIADGMRAIGRRRQANSVAESASPERDAAGEGGFTARSILVGFAVALVIAWPFGLIFGMSTHNATSSRVFSNLVAGFFLAAVFVLQLALPVCLAIGLVLDATVFISRRWNSPNNGSG
ncbi:MAG: hypothetical protein U0232_17785 [Thermomicrobiales bacterium]